jgi:histidinol-phosphate aminotransferase
MSDVARALLAEQAAERVVRPEIRALSAYAVAKTGSSAEAWIKLDAMENPYPLPDAVKARLSDALASVAINRYPDAAGEGVKRALRSALKIPEDAALLLGNGSDELIQVIVSSLAKPGAVVLAPEPSFVMYRMDAVFASTRFVGVPLKADFSLDREAMLAAIERESPAVIFLAYPNNPTGNLFADADIEAIIEAAPGLVVIDEAYYAFADASFLSRVPERPNLLVLRTLSKVGMAGIRLGYAVAAPAWIAELNKVRQPYNVNALTQAAVEALLSDTGWIGEQAAAIRGERARLASTLERLPEVRTYPTQTNFVVARVSDSNGIFDGLKARRILIKNLHGWHPLLANCLRITVGTPGENDLLLSALAELSASSGPTLERTR